MKKFGVFWGKKRKIYKDVILNFHFRYVAEIYIVLIISYFFSLVIHAINQTIFAFFQTILCYFLCILLIDPRYCD